MLVLNQKNAKIERVVRDTENQKQKEIQMHCRDAQLSAEILRMNRQSGMIKRTDDVKKIAKFNQLFFAKIKELTDIRTKLGRTDKDEVIKIIREYKKRN